MIKGKNGLTGLCLLLGCLNAQPVMALSVKATHALQQTNHSITTNETPETAELLTHSSSLNDFLPKLIGPHLYLYLLQSDQFITLQGVTESLWEKYMIQKP